MTNKKWLLIVILSILTTLFLVFILIFSNEIFVNNIFVQFLTALGGIVAIVGSTWNSKKEGVLKLTHTGLITLCIIIAGLSFSLNKQYQESKELEQIRIKNLHYISNIMVDVLTPFRFVSKELRAYPQSQISVYLEKDIIKVMTQYGLPTSKIKKLTNPENSFDINFLKLKRKGYYIDREFYSVMRDFSKEFYERVNTLSNFDSKEIDSDIIKLLKEASHSNFIIFMKDSIREDFSSPGFDELVKEDYEEFIKKIYKVEQKINIEQQLNKGSDPKWELF